MRIDLPELRDTDEKHAAALARVVQIEADWQKDKEASSVAARVLAQAQERLAAEKINLTKVQESLTRALFEEKPVDKLQREVSGHTVNLSSLEALVKRAQAEADEANAQVMRRSAPLGRAQSEVDTARFYQLIVQLAAAITPAIPLSRELSRLSHQLGLSLEASGYVLNLQRPQISRYTVADDGSLSFYMS